MSSFSIIELMTLMMSAMSAVAVLYLAMQVSIIKRIYMRETHANRMERTLEAMELPTEVTKTMSQVLHQHYRGDMHAIFEDPELRASLYSTLNTLENLSFGILSGIYDENVAFAQMGSALPRFYDVIQRFVYESREEFLSSSQYIKLEQLARMWAHREKGHYKRGAL